MDDDEKIEKVRQEIMRFHELLMIMRQKVDAGDRAYAQIMARSNLTPDEIKGMKEKDVQWNVAEQIMSDLTPLSRAVSTMRFEARNLERAFEELYDIIAAAEGQ